MGPNYDFVEQWKANSEEARDRPRERRKFVKDWAERVGVTEKVAWHWFCTDQLAAITFAKDPRRQSSHEKTAANWICQIPGVSNFRNLPSGGPGSLYVQGGRVFSEEDLVNDNVPKSIDFVWDFVEPVFGKVLTLYAAHKYTAGGGGSQTNQYHDLIDYTKQASELEKDVGYRFLTLADGSFYEMENARLGYTPMEKLKKTAGSQGSDLCQAMTCAALPSYLADCSRGLLADESLSADETQQFEAFIRELERYT